MSKRIGIIGAGAVGATTAFTLAVNGVCNEILLYDINVDIAIGKAIDIEQATNYSPSGTIVKGVKKLNQLKNCDIIVITAGVPRKENMTREDLLLINAKVIKTILEDVKEHSPDSILICVSNPLDVITYLCHKITKFEHNKIIGMAGALDGARMSYEINNTLNFGRAQTKTIVIGDHGENMIPLVSNSSVGGIPLNQLVSKEDMENIIQRTKQGGANIVKHLGTSAYYAPARAVAITVEAILNDDKKIIASSCMLNNHYGHNNVSVGVPAVIGKNGIEKIIELDLDEELQKKFDISVKTIKDGINILQKNNFF